jgi:hypothetical protein
MLVDRRRLPERMCCGEEAATIMRRTRSQLVSHRFEQIGEGVFGLGHLPVIRRRFNGRDDPLLLVADLGT